MPEKMYCPRCGKQFSEKTSYCRTCGLSLDGVSEIVSGEADTAPATSAHPNPTVMRVGMGLAIFGTILGLINVGLKGLDLYPQQYGKLIFLAFFVAGIATLGAAFLFPSKKYSKRKRPESTSDPISTAQLDTAPLMNELPSAKLRDIDINFPKDSREPVPVEPQSVTEHTTRHLE